MMKKSGMIFAINKKAMTHAGPLDLQLEHYHFIQLQPKVKLTSTVHTYAPGK